MHPETRRGLAVARGRGGGWGASFRDDENFLEEITVIVECAKKIVCFKKVNFIVCKLHLKFQKVLTTWPFTERAMWPDSLGLNPGLATCLLCGLGQEYNL